jgi:hypothetical protein
MRIILTIIGILWASLAMSQATDELSSSWDKEKNAFVVKQYHEFIERFNFDQKTPIVKFFKRNYPGYPLSRPDLLRSLFNIENKSWDPQLIDAFVKDVTGGETPVKLDFYDEDWYAEVACVFEYHKVPHKGSIILKLYHYENNSSKWQVVGINQDFLPKVEVTESFPIVRDPTRILNPMSHNADFASLYRAFRDLESLPNYFAREYWSPEINFFFRELKERESLPGWNRRGDLPLAAN